MTWQTRLRGLAHGKPAGAPDPADFDRMLDELMAAGGPSIVYQPVYLIESDQMIAVEALSRVPAGLNPGEWFDYATAIGRGPELETVAARNALAPLDADRRKELGWHSIGVNVSPETLSDPAFTSTLRPHLGSHVAIEISQRGGSVDVITLQHQIARARELGVRIAVNSVECDPMTQQQYLLQIQPEVVKLDPAFTRLLLDSENRRELAERTLLGCQQHGAFVIAVGVEEQRDLKRLRRLGVEGAQGYLLGEPLPLEQLAAAMR